jgi:hypothetical protein
VDGLKIEEFSGRPSGITVADIGNSIGSNEALVLLARR